MREKNEAVRLSSNEGNNMKGARQRGPVRSERIFRKTLLASALYAVLSTPHAYAQSTGFDRGISTSPNRFDGRMIRAQQRVSSVNSAGKGSTPSSQDRDPKGLAMQPIQQVDQTPRTGIARLNLNGSLDESFNPGAGADSTGYAIVQQFLPNVQTNLPNLSYYIIGGNFANFRALTRAGWERGDIPPR